MEAARLPGVGERTFRWQTDRLEADELDEQIGVDGVLHVRLAQLCIEEITAAKDLRRRRLIGWKRSGQRESDAACG